jgi:hypothetical protein
MLNSSQQAIRFAGSVLGAQHDICAYFHTPYKKYWMLPPVIEESFERGEEAIHNVAPRQRREYRQRRDSAGINMPATAQSNRFEVHVKFDTYLQKGRVSCVAG